jgi:uncharacterized protein DUF6496
LQFYLDKSLDRNQKRIVGAEEGARKSQRAFAGDEPENIMLGTRFEFLCGCNVPTLRGTAMATKYGKKSHESVKSAMHEFKHGKLKSGKSKTKVKNPKQAIAIGLSEARKKGAKVPPMKKTQK